MTPQQEQSAIELARRVINQHNEGQIKICCCGECALSRSLLSLHGRLEDITLDRDKCKLVANSSSSPEATGEIEQLRAELTEARKEHATVIGNLAAALFPNSPKDSTEAEFMLDAMGACQAIRRLRSDRADRRAILQRLADEATRIMEDFPIARGLGPYNSPNKLVHGLMEWLATELTEARGKLEIARTDMREVVVGTKRVVLCGCLGCLTDDCDHWGVDCHLKDYTLCHIGRTVDNQITPTDKS